MKHPMKRQCVNCLYYRHHCCSQDCTDVRETDTCGEWKPWFSRRLSDNDLAEHDRQARRIREEKR